VSRQGGLARLSSGCRSAAQAWLGRLGGPLGPFYLVLGAALIARVGVDAVRGVWRIHSGELFPWRHLPGVPLYSTRWLLVEWMVSLAAGLAMVLGLRLRLAVGVALLASIAGLSQRSSNQQSLMLIVLAFLALDPSGSGFSDPRRSPNISLVKSQLAIVYVFSALEKVLGGFLDGSALRNSMTDSPWLHGPLLEAAFDGGLLTALSCGLVLTEFALPVLLLRWPRLGVTAVALLHLAFAVVMPGVLPFGLLMLAMSLLFLGPRSEPRCWRAWPASSAAPASVRRASRAWRWR
jgi:hypothetical protein